MTLPTGILDRTGIGNKAREDLSDIIYNISPTETPFMTLIGRGSCDQDAHEWTTDALATAVVTNRHVDGDDFVAEGGAGQVGTGSAGVQITAGSRIGNYCQISRKDIVVSRRANLVRKAGRKNELAYQIAKAGRELKRDMETSLLQPIGSAVAGAVQGTASVAGYLGAYVNWMRANTNRRAAAVAGADPAALVNGFPTGTGVTDSSATRPFSEADLLSVIGSCYIAGGDIDTILMEPTMKQKWSQYMFSPDTTNSGRIATQFQDQGKNPSKGATALGAVDVYVSDFGVINVIPDRFQRSRDIPVFEADMWSTDYLDPFQQFEVAKTGDSEKRVLLVDYTLRASNSASSGIVADVSNTATPQFATSINI